MFPLNEVDAAALIRPCQAVVTGNNLIVHVSYAGRSCWFLLGKSWAYCPKGHCKSPWEYSECTLCEIRSKPPKAAFEC